MKKILKKNYEGYSSRIDQRVNVQQPCHFYNNNNHNTPSRTTLPFSSKESCFESGAQSLLSQKKALTTGRHQISQATSSQPKRNLVSVLPKKNNLNFSSSLNKKPQVIKKPPNHYSWSETNSTTDISSTSLPTTNHSTAQYAVKDGRSYRFCCPSSVSSSSTKSNYADKNLLDLLTTQKEKQQQEATEESSFDNISELEAYYEDYYTSLTGENIHERCSAEETHNLNIIENDHLYNGRPLLSSNQSPTGGMQTPQHEPEQFDANHSRPSSFSSKSTSGQRWKACASLCRDIDMLEPDSYKTTESVLLDNEDRTSSPMINMTVPTAATLQHPLYTNSRLDRSSGRSASLNPSPRFKTAQFKIYGLPEHDESFRHEATFNDVTVAATTSINNILKGQSNYTEIKSTANLLAVADISQANEPSPFNTNSEVHKIPSQMLDQYSCRDAVGGTTGQHNGNQLSTQKDVKLERKSNWSSSVGFNLLQPKNKNDEAEERDNTFSNFMHGKAVGKDSPNVQYEHVHSSLRRQGYEESSLIPNIVRSLHECNSRDTSHKQLRVSHASGSQTSVIAPIQYEEASNPSTAFSYRLVNKFLEPQTESKRLNVTSLKFPINASIETTECTPELQNRNSVLMQIEAPKKHFPSNQEKESPREFSHSNYEHTFLVPSTVDNPCKNNFTGALYEKPHSPQISSSPSTTVAIPQKSSGISEPLEYRHPQKSFTSQNDLACSGIINSKFSTIASNTYIDRVEPTPLLLAIHQSPSGLLLKTSPAVSITPSLNYDLAHNTPRPVHSQARGPVSFTAITVNNRRKKLQTLSRSSLNNIAIRQHGSSKRIAFITAFALIIIPIFLSLLYILFEKEFANGILDQFLA